MVYGNNGTDVITVGPLYNEPLYNEFPDITNPHLWTPKFLPSWRFFPVHTVQQKIWSCSMWLTGHSLHLSVINHNKMLIECCVISFVS